jgi:hypothetical protein
MLFITRWDATAAIDAAGGCLTRHAQCMQAPVPTDVSQRRDYRFGSPHDEQRMIPLALLPVVVNKSSAGWD